jgi:diguanylate cyclase (GGDEF)-like protein/PAS domain S-box-containing protein
MLNQITSAQMDYLSLAILLLGFVSFFLGYLISRKQLKATLTHSTKIFEKTAVGIAQVTPDGRFLEVNQSLCTLLGYTAEELCRLQFTDITHPDHLESDRASIRSLLDNSNPSFLKEKRYIRKDGSIIWCQVAVSVVRDRAGNPEYFIAVITDISDRKQTETALQESKERFRNLVETSSDWVWEVNERAVYTYASPKVRDLLGYEPEEVLGKTPFALMPEAEARRVSEIFTTFVTQLLPFQCIENTNRHKDGRLVVLETSGVPIFDADGKFRGYRGIDRDITQRKQIEAARLQAEQLLRENQERLNNILNSLQDLVWSISLETHQYIYINPAAETIYGRAISEFIENRNLWLEAVHPEDRQQVETASRLLVEQGTSQDLEYRIVRPDGEVRWIRDRAQLNYDSSGKPIRIDGIATDITEKKQALETLQRIEARNRAIIDAMPDLMLRVRRDGLCLDFIPPREPDSGTFLPIEKHLCEVLPPQLLQDQLQAIERAISTGELQVYEHQLEKCGRVSYEEVRISPLGEEEALILVRDITDRKQAEIDLHENEERLQQIISTISDGLVVANPQGKVLFVNPAAEFLFGLSQKELLEQSFGLPCLVEETTEICIQQPTGGLITAEMRAGEINWEGEMAYLVSLRDITERYKAEQVIQESEEKYRRIVETAAEGIWVIDRDNKTNFVNLQMARLLGYSVEEMTGKSLFEFMDEEGIAIAQSYAQRRRQGIQENHDFKFRCKDGTELWAIVSTNPFFDKEGNYAGVLGMITDITDRKGIEQALYESERRLEGILSSIQDVVWSASATTLKTLYINPTAEKVFGRPASEFYNNPILWFKIVHPEDKKQVKHYLKQLHETGSLEMEYRIVRPDGEVRWLYNRSQVIDDGSGKAIRIDATDTDITERKQAEEQLQRNAFYDPLTDLPNRALFTDRLEHALQRLKRHPESLFAVLFLDLDGFKLINDSLGHLTGDRLLQGFARRLGECLRPSDTLARLGGDEFTILIEDIKTIKDVIIVAERILQTLTLPFNLGGQQVFTNTSIGIALSNSDYQRSEEILRDADTAMYRAKAQGKGCYAVFDPKMYLLAVSRLQLETDLRQAIEHREFQVFYQPIASLETGKITEFEALIRWQHPKRGLISPAEFIPIAEETGLIVPIGQWILKEACQQMRTWQEQFPQQTPLKVNINLSGKQLRGINFIEQIDNVLAETGLDGSTLKLEITESLLIENVEAAANLLLELRKRNIELCLDDFGTGYSSLSYLQRFPINTIKIDRSFVRRMKPKDDSSEIVRAIVALAHILGMTVIAEGIETEEQLEQLKKLTCEKGQGYLFSKPLSREDAEALLQKGRRK